MTVIATDGLREAVVKVNVLTWSRCFSCRCRCLYCVWLEGDVLHSESPSSCKAQWPLCDAHSCLHLSLSRFIASSPRRRRRWWFLPSNPQMSPRGKIVLCHWRGCRDGPETQSLAKMTSSSPSDNDRDCGMMKMTPEKGLAAAAKRPVQNSSLPHCSRPRIT